MLSNDIMQNHGIAMKMLQQEVIKLSVKTKIYVAYHFTFNMLSYTKHLKKYQVV